MDSLFAVGGEVQSHEWYQTVVSPYNAWLHKTSAELCFFTSAPHLHNISLSCKTTWRNPAWENVTGETDAFSSRCGICCGTEPWRKPAVPAILDSYPGVFRVLRKPKEFKEKCWLHKFFSTKIHWNTHFRRENSVGLFYASQVTLLHWVVARQALKVPVRRKCWAKYPSVLPRAEVRAASAVAASEPALNLPISKGEIWNEAKYCTHQNAGSYCKWIQILFFTNQENPNQGQSSRFDTDG